MKTMCQEDYMFLKRLRQAVKFWSWTAKHVAPSGEGVELVPGLWVS
jgi:hypothetical protein